MGVCEENVRYRVPYHGNVGVSLSVTFRFTDIAMFLLFP